MERIIDVWNIQKKINDGFTYNHLQDYGYDDGKENMIPVSEANEVLDAIESDIKDISCLIKDINGLSEIDEIKYMLKALEDKLY